MYFVKFFGIFILLFSVKNSYAVNSSFPFMDLPEELRYKIMSHVIFKHGQVIPIKSKQEAHTKVVSKQFYNLFSDYLFFRLINDLSGEEIDSVDFSNDERQILVKLKSSLNTFIWDIESGEKLLQLQNEKKIKFAQLSNDNKKAIIVGDHKICQVWDVPNGTELFTLRVPRAPISTAHFSNDNQKIVTISEDQSVRIWNAHSGAILFHLFPESFIDFADFSQESDSVFITKGDQRSILNVNTQLLDHQPSKINSKISLRNNKKITTHYAMAKVLNTDTGKKIDYLLGHTSWITCAHFFYNNQFILTGAQDGKVIIWDANLYTEVITLKAHYWPITSILFSKDGKKIITVSSDGTFKIWYISNLIQFYINHKNSDSA